MEIYKVGESPFSPEEYAFTIKLDHPVVSSINTYKHCNLPLMGIGPESRPFIYFDDLIDKSLIPSVLTEVEDGFAKGRTKFNKIIANGIVPTELNGQKTIDSLLANVEKYARDQKWKEEIKKIARKGDLKTYFHQYFGLAEPWEGLAMFREYTGTYEDKVKPSQWMPIIDYFPSLKKFVEALPFEYVGYVMIFKSKPNSPVLIHRDYFPVNHRVHFINIRLNQKPRPFFLYDIQTGKKNYIDPRYDAYFFNEIDLHGLDPEPESHMTLRIEGQFKPEFLNKIGLPSGETFNWGYPRAKSFLDSGQFKIEQNTDI